METKRSFFICLSLTFLLVGFGSEVLAQAAERSRDELTSMAVEGITLETPAREAFDQLLAQGYDPGIPDFEAWDKPLLQFTRGDVSGAEGFNQIQLSREGDRLTNIVLHIQRPRGARFSIEQEINRARNHFNIPSDSKACTQGPTMGSCSVASPDKVMNYHQTTMAVSRTEQVTVNLGVVGGN